MLKSYKKVGQSRHHDIYEFSGNKKEKYYTALGKSEDNPNVYLQMKKHGLKETDRKKVEKSTVYEDFKVDKWRDKL